MPQSLSIGVFVLGAVLLLISLVSGGFKIFGSEMPGATGKIARGVAFVIGLFLIGFALYHYGDAQKEAPKPGPAPAPAAGPVAESQPATSDRESKAVPTAGSLNNAATRQVFADEATDYRVGRNFQMATFDGESWKPFGDVLKD